MERGLFISLLNPGIALVLASVFLILWAALRRRHLMLLAAGYTASAIGFLFQHFMLPGGLVPSKLTSNAAFLTGTFCVCAAVAMRSGRPVPYLGLGAMAAAGFGALCWFMLVDPDLTWRIYMMNFTLGAMCLLIAAELRRSVNRSPTTGILFALALLSGVNFFVRTIAIIAIHGPYESYEGFYDSTYWMTAVLSHAILSLLIALTLLADTVLDLVAELKSETLTDPLSGLLNRRGFEARGTALLERCAPAGLPVALVVADLDRFKALNDRYGHAAGDRVIVEFAARLKMAAGARGVAGRLGGEEFAILLPLADLAAARLVAEGVRTIFSIQPIEGLPPDVRVTASFGVASRAGAEPLAELFRRADEALYHAKKGGRDSVRLSYQRLPERPAEAKREG